MNKETFDLVVIGGGPAGYSAAIKASQRGLSVAIIEKRKQGHLGGTCLNVGCIPTKFLLESAKTWHKLQKLSAKGFYADNLSYKWQEILQLKDQLITRQRQGLQHLMKKHNISVYSGHGSFAEDNNKKAALYRIKLQERILEAKYVIIATGSKVRSLPQVKDCNHPHLFYSDQVLQIPKIPQHMIIIGGGVIGMEFASLFSMMGSKVTVIEAGPTLLREFDPDTVKELLKCWKQYDFTAHTSCVLEQVDKQEENMVVTIKDSQQKTQSLSCDALLMAVGRAPMSEGLGLEYVGVERDDKNFIAVTPWCETAAQGVFAVGDVIATPSLAHTATAEAHHVVDFITQGSKKVVDYNNNPLAVYSYPELAAVGAKESDLHHKNIPYHLSRFPFSIMAKAVIEGYPEGFIKILSHQETGEILGAHLVGGRATEMISEIVLARALETTVEEFAHAIRPHPTLSEVHTEVGFQALKEPLHI